MNNKWIRGAIPALLIHCSIGTVYCWSLLRDAISTSLNCSNNEIEWAFSLAIFFLGMSAAFLGNLVEKNVTQAAGFSAACFCLGMIGTSVSIGLGSVIGVLLSYGCLMGIGLGIGYLTPFKTLMMWVCSKNQYASLSVSHCFSSLMGTRTCSMVSRSRMVTALSAGVLSSPTVSKSTVTQ